MCDLNEMELNQEFDENKFQDESNELVKKVMSSNYSRKSVSSKEKKVFRYKE